MAVAIAIFQTARSPKQHEKRRIDPKHRGYTLKTSITAPPSLFRGWHFRARSAHARDAESDSFLACAAKKKERLAAVSTRRSMPSVSSALVGVYHRALCEMLRFSYFFEMNQNDTYVVSDRTQTRIFLSTPIPKS